MRYVIFIIVVSSLLSGCGYFTVNQTTVKQVTSTQRSVPPSVEIEVKNETFSTKQGSYCWSTGNMSECADMASPLDLVKNDEAIQVSPGEFIIINVDRTPIEQGINLEALDSENVGDISMEGNSFKAPTEKGTYILIYYGYWDDNGSGTSGDSSYVFKLEVQ